MKKPDYIYRKGKYRYFRRPDGTTEQLPNCLTREDENRPEFRQVYEPLLRALIGSNHPPVVTTIEPVVDRIDARVPFAPGTIGYFIERYIAKQLPLRKPSTRKQYLICLDVMRQRVGTAMLHDLTPEGVDRYSLKIAEAFSNSVADVHTTLFANLWESAKGNEHFAQGDKHDPTIKRTRHYVHDGKGHPAWPADVIDHFDGHAEPHLKAARMGLLYTGQRGVDLVKMRWEHFDGELIAVTQQKTGEQVWLACPAPLAKLLAELKRKARGNGRADGFIFTNAWGKPWGSAASLSNAITNHLKKIGQGDYSMHGLRKNAGMELALAGCTVPEIMAVLGHRSPKMAMFYVQQADKRTLGRAATAKWNSAIAAKTPGFPSDFPQPRAR